MPAGGRKSGEEWLVRRGAGRPGPQRVEVARVSGAWFRGRGAVARERAQDERVVGRVHGCNRTGPGPMCGATEGRAHGAVHFLVC